MSPGLLATKFVIPPAHKNIVPRPRLIQKLNEAWDQGKSMILISAPAGYGKTTLVTDWLRNSPVKSSWLSLDPADNDPARFLGYFTAALRQVDEGIGKSAQTTVQSPPLLPAEVVQISLINEIAQLPDSFILVLDDYQVIQTMLVHQQIDFLLSHLPRQLHFVILTREDPPLPLARLRARDQLLEIRRDDLRFSQKECGEFFQRMKGITLSVDDIAVLEQRTEGWVTGLQLAALSMQGCDNLPGFIQAFSGSSRFILDFLIEEVFDRQMPEVQDFLLKTSILERLSGSLCAAVTNQVKAEALLEMLEKANLFIIPLDQSRTWYRYHHLFAELLRQRLRMIYPDLAPDLYLRASRWFETEGLFEEAIQHALAAQAWGEAARMIGYVAEGMLKRGEMVTLISWFKLLPEVLLLNQPTLGLSYAWAFLVSGRYQEAEALLEQYEATAKSNPQLLGPLATAQAFAARALGNNQRVIEKSKQALELMPDSEVSSRCLIEINLGLVYWHEGRLQDLWPILDEAEALAARIGNEYARMTAQIFRARALASQGLLRRAETALRLLVCDESGAPILALAHFDLACIYHEWMDDERAWAHHAQGMEICKRSGNREFQHAGYLQKTLFWLAQGNLKAAQAEIEKALNLAVEYNPVTKARCFAGQALVALGKDDLCSARQWVEKMPADGDPHSLYRFVGLTQARLLIAEGRLHAADEELARLDERARAGGWGFARIAILVLHALAAETHTAAMAFLEEALHLAEPEGFLHTFVEAGAGLVPLLQETARRSPAPEYIGRILAAFSQNLPKQPGAQLVEPLSERELEVLRLVTAGLSNREIASELIVSPSTVKSHIHHICGKLGARNRTEAAMLAKAGNLF